MKKEVVRSKDFTPRFICFMLNKYNQFFNHILFSEKLILHIRERKELPLNVSNKHNMETTSHVLAKHHLSKPRL